MFEVRGFWLPDGETHFGPLLRDGPEFAGGPTYQLRKLLPMMQYINNFRHCIDIGAHCGMWTRPLQRMFTRVTAFEPVARHVECFRRNVDSRNVTLFQMALGDVVHDKVTLHTFPDSTGNTTIAHGSFVNEGEHTSTMTTLDRVLGTDITPIDFIKIDCEGFEYFVLKGGERVIRQHRPTILVEQKPGKGKQFGIGDLDALKLLTSWGAKRVFEMSGDYGYIFRP